jgi:hypothetical protein
MSEDLRYYFFDHEADEQPPISSEEGWKSMQQLLDKEMPVSKRGRRRYLFFVVASLAGIVFLATSIPIKNYFEQTSTQTALKENITGNKVKEDNVTQKEVEQEDNNVFSLNSNNYKAATSINSNAKITPNNESNNTQFDLGSGNTNAMLLSKEAGKELLYSNAITQNAVDQNVIDQNKTTRLKDEFAAPDNQDVSSTNKSETKDEKKTSTINNLNKKQSNKNFERSWQLNAGLGINVSLSNTLHSLHPYPFAELKYNFSPRFFVGASVGLFSPVGSKANGVKKTVYVNDTSFNVSKYNEKLNYNRLTYIDAALTAGVKINKKMSLQTGVQVSRLISSSTSTTLEPYDFNSNIISMQTPDVTTIPVTPSAAPVYNNRIDVQKFDIRYIAGINYDLKKVSLGLQYQAGINPILKGDIVTGDKNKIIMLRAAYRFK